MLVVDASALADALLDDGPSGRRARSALAADDHWAAPAHIHIEVMSVIRGRLLGQKITIERAEDATTALVDMALDQVDPTRLLPRMWELRGNVTAYDAAYVAAAEQLGCPLLTGDRRLSRVRGVRCEIRTISAA
ncbi:type II toxin-antitoxin system VapC family toxin [Saccharopolyspora sp. NPDC047091]|uniref:type II toxin-antitoxin system VapC family toxin n=1 Tax=Saccharopolyspora sp. NPDC047091 TaxID=3155924 RepID=UPI0033D7963F